MRLFNYLLTGCLLASASVGPSLADPHHHGHHGNYQAKHWKKKYRKAVRRSWNEERGLYQRHWNRPNAQARLRYDAQLREQWLRYHNNNWSGNYSWSNYNDPRFIDYLHTNNPGLLTNLRSVLGF